MASRPSRSSDRMKKARTDAEESHVSFTHDERKEQEGDKGKLRSGVVPLSEVFVVMLKYGAQTQPLVLCAGTPLLEMRELLQSVFPNLRAKVPVGLMDESGFAYPISMLCRYPGNFSTSQFVVIADGATIGPSSRAQSQVTPPVQMPSQSSSSSSTSTSIHVIPHSQSPHRPSRTTKRGDKPIISEQQDIDAVEMNVGDDLNDEGQQRFSASDLFSGLELDSAASFVSSLAPLPAPPGTKQRTGLGKTSGLPQVPGTEENLKRLHDATLFSRAEFNDVINSFLEHAERGVLSYDLFVSFYMEFASGVFLSLELLKPLINSLPIAIDTVCDGFRMRSITFSNESWFLKRLFNSFDADKNGVVDMQEFCTALSKWYKGSNEERVALLFELIDEDSDDIISLDELKQFARSTLLLAVDIASVIGDHVHEVLSGNTSASVSNDIASQIHGWCGHLRKQITEAVDSGKITDQIFSQMDPTNSNQISPDNLMTGYVRATNGGRRALARDDLFLSFGGTTNMFGWTPFPYIDQE